MENRAVWTSGLILLILCLTVVVQSAKQISAQKFKKTKTDEKFSGLVLKNFTCSHDFACASACFTDKNCSTAEFYKLENRCATYKNSSYGISVPAGKNITRFSIVYCSQPPTPRKNANYTKGIATGTYVKLGTTVGYTCMKGFAFHSQDLVDGGFTATGKATDAERFGPITMECKGFGTWEPPVSNMPRCSDFVECKKTASGKEYQGKIAVSETGQTCLNWDTQVMDNLASLKNYNRFPVDDNVTMAKNYCRNPLSLERPFCIINNVTSPRQFCNISYCEDPTPFQCVWSKRGTDYLGEENTTQSGIPCESWNSNLTSLSIYAIYVQMLPDNTSAINKCRNPDNVDPRPWCYAMNVRWDYCSVPYCIGYP